MLLLQKESMRRGWIVLNKNTIFIGCMRICIMGVGDKK